MTVEAMDIARRLLDRYPGLQTRHAVHAAACEDAAVDVLCTCDGDFSIIRGLKVLRPEQIK